MKKEFVNLALLDNTYDQQFELAVGGLTAFIEYQLHHAFLTLIHTEVPVELRGQSVGSALVEKVLQLGAERHLTVIPLCPFVARYLRLHPEWYRLVAQAYRPVSPS